MMDLPEPTTLAEGRFVRLVRRGRWEYAERVKVQAAVMIVPVTDDGKLVVLEQFRAPLAGTVVELPAGLVGDIEGEEDEAAATAAHRELIEETGYEASELRWLTSGPPSAGMCSEVIAFYLARGLKRVGPGGGDHSEDIVVHEVPLAQVVPWLNERAAAGRHIDPKIYVGLYFASEALR